MESLQEVDGGHTDTLYGAAVDFKPVPGCTGGRDRNRDNRHKEAVGSDCGRWLCVGRPDKG